MKSFRLDLDGEGLTVWGWLWLAATVLIEFGMINVAVKLGFGDVGFDVRFIAFVLAGGALCIFGAGVWLLNGMGIPIIKATAQSAKKVKVPTDY